MSSVMRIMAHCGCCGAGRALLAVPFRCCACREQGSQLAIRSDRNDARVPVGGLDHSGAVGLNRHASLVRHVFRLVQFRWRAVPLDAFVAASEVLLIMQVRSLVEALEVIAIHLRMSADTRE